MYRFALAPENFYYDIQGRTYVKTRDVYEAGDEYSQMEFLRGAFQQIRTVCVEKSALLVYGTYVILQRFAMVTRRKSIIFLFIIIVGLSVIFMSL